MMYEDGLRVLVCTPQIRQYAFGGRRLAALGKVLPDTGPAAESWEVSLHPAALSVMREGSEEASLAALLDAHPNWMPSGRVPLVKFLDIAGDLPVHVHPSDEQATAWPGADPGKDEAWIVVEAGPAAAMWIGFASPPSRAELAKAVRAGHVRDLLRRRVPRPGDVYFIPAGTPHAARDVVLWEVQETSDRSIFGEAHDLYGRPVAAVEFAAWAAAFVQTVQRVAAADDPPANPWALDVCAGWSFGCRHFAVETFGGAGSVVVGAGVVTCLAGSARIKGEGQSADHRVRAGDTVLLPGETWRVQGDEPDTRWVRTWCPDRADAAHVKAWHDDDSGVKAKDGSGTRRRPISIDGCGVDNP